MAKNNITISILGDAKKFKDATSQVNKSMSGISGNAVKLAGVLGVAFGARELVDFGKDLFALGQTLELSNNKITTVFGDAEAGVREWADSVNEQFGLTETGVASLAASTADLLKPLGFTAEAAATMSQEMTGLAPALSQWSEGQYDAAAVSEIMQKAMLGETDGLKALGIAISAAETEARALEIAQADGRDEVTAMDKALAVQQLILEKSTDAQNAYSGGTDTLAGKTALLKARWAEVKEYLATALIPVFNAVGGYVVDTLVPALQTMALGLQVLWAKHGPEIVAVFELIGDWVSEHWPEISETVTAALETIVTVITSVVEVVTILWGVFGEYILAIIINLAAVLVPVVQGLFDVIQGIFSAFSALFRGDWSAMWEGIKQAFSGIWTVIKALIVGAFDLLKISIGLVMDGINALLGLAWDKVVAGVSGLGSRISTAAVGIFDGVKEAFRTAINYIIDKWNALSFSIPSFSFLGVETPGVTVDTPNIPRLATGGRVSSPTVAYLGDYAGVSTNPEFALRQDQLQAVIGAALAQAGGGGARINIENQTVLDGKHMMREAELQMRMAAA